MRRQGPSITITIEDPNGPREVQKLLKRIMIERLLAMRGERRP